MYLTIWPEITLSLSLVKIVIIKLFVTDTQQNNVSHKRWYIIINQVLLFQDNINEFILIFNAQ